MSCYEVYEMIKMEKPHEEVRIQRHFLAPIIEYKYIGTITQKQLENANIKDIEINHQITDKNIVQKIGRILGIDLTNKAIMIKRTQYCK